MKGRSLISDFTKSNEETLEQYIWRIDGLIRSGKYRNWKEITPDVNKELFGDNESKYRDESAYRKPCEYTRRFYDAGVFGTEDEYIDAIRKERLELEKERQRNSDERVALNRLIRPEARKDSLIDMFNDIMSKEVKREEMDFSIPKIISDNDMLIHLTDLHHGIFINNFKNFCNENTIKTRIEKYIKKVISTQKLHKSENCYIVIGEILSGIIHSNLRLQNNMNLIEQFKDISTIISCAIKELSKNFNNVYVYITPGNHSRIVAKKEEALDGENMDILLPFYLKASMQNIGNVVICENEVEPEIANFIIRGKRVMASHGHKDSPSNVVQNFTMMFGYKPDIVLLGHRHTNGMTTVFDTKVIESGCVSGSDDYAISIRKCNNPELTISIINSNGLECLYDVTLN